MVWMVSYGWGWSVLVRDGQFWLWYGWSVIIGDGQLWLWMVSYGIRALD